MRRGWAWLHDGFRLWLRNPALLSFAAFGYLLTLLVASLLPYVGQVLATLLMPMMSLGVLNACRSAEAGRKTGPDILFSGFKANLPELVKIGGLYLIASLVVMKLSSLFDGGLLMALMTGGTLDEDSARNPDLLPALLAALVLSVPVMMAYWFAPLLAGWGSLPATKALFFSFHACLRNWRPFLAYAIALLLFGTVLPALLLGVIGLLSPTLASVLSIPVPLVVVPVLFASFYTNACDVFGPPDSLLASADGQ